MKRFLFAFVAACVPALVAINAANAQRPVNYDLLDPQKNVTDFEKVITPVKNDMIVLGPISQRALKDFAKEYKNVRAESWLKIRDGYFATFNTNGVKNSIFYNPNGKWFGTLKSYSEDKLPYEIRDMVKHKYYDYSIIVVEEVETIDSYGIPTYLIHLQDKNNIKLMRIFDGEMYVWKEYKKAIAD